jgi:predicted ThiF/HesA family dinucleotide-utilizing enzyme
VFVEAVPALVADQTALIVELGGVAALKIADGRQVPLAAQLIKALQRPC